MTFKNYAYHLQETAIPADLCELISGMYGAGSQAEIYSPLQGSRIDVTARRSTVEYLEADHWLAGLMRHFIWAANEKVWQYDLTGIQVVQLTKYGSGDLFTWHKDAPDAPYADESRPQWRGLTRKLSATLLLSLATGFDGGNLRLKDEYTYVWQDPGFRMQGSVVVFPSNMLHEVTELSFGERRSVVAWALGPPLR